MRGYPRPGKLSSQPLGTTRSQVPGVHRLGGRAGLRGGGAGRPAGGQSQVVRRLGGRQEGTPEFPREHCRLSLGKEKKIL